MVINNSSKQTKIRMLMRRLAVCGWALLFFVQQIAIAQSRFPEIDIDPPVIDHEALETGIAGDAQRFSAMIIDDRGIDYVELYYRASVNGEYSKIIMQADAAQIDTYVAVIDTEAEQSRVEYYIEAADTGGNRVLKGFPFFPLVRELEQPVTTLPVVTTPSSDTADTGKSPLLYVLLGALAVGLLVSASSGGGDGPPVDQTDTVPLTITVTSPAN